MIANSTVPQGSICYLLIGVNLDGHEVYYLHADLFLTFLIAKALYVTVKVTDFLRKFQSA